MPNPDLKDYSPYDISAKFISLIVLSRKCQMEYSREKKVKIFYEALTVKRWSILGNSPPQAITEKFKLWSQAVQQHAK